jgi:hypothetical protein
MDYVFSDCGVENSKGNKFCRRCGINLIEIDRAREFISEFTSSPPTPQFESTTIIKIVAWVGIFGFLFVTAGTAILQVIDDHRSPIPFLFALCGFSALVLICLYLIKLISPPAKTEEKRLILPPQPEQKYSPAQSREARRLNDPPYSQQSVIEEPTQQFEDERRIK